MIIYFLFVQDYVDVFKKYGVNTIVRLNRKLYNKQRFTEHGFMHVDHYFIDGTCPDQQILNSFLELCETGGNMAIHCKAGLGRTGTLMGCYIMQTWEIPAAETMGWLRICRPGSVIGPQQQYLVQQQEEMFRRGRALRGGADPVPMGQVQPRIPSRSVQESEKKKLSPTNAQAKSTSIPVSPVARVVPRSTALNSPGFSKVKSTIPPKSPGLASAKSKVVTRTSSVPSSSPGKR